MKNYVEHPFFRFYKAMVDEYERHVPEKGESWRTCDQEYLRESLDKIGFRYFKKNDTNELLDMANVEAMLWLRYIYVVDEVEKTLQSSTPKVKKE